MSDESVAGRLTVTSVDGLVQFRFSEEHVEIVLACDRVKIPLAEWHHLAKVYGKWGK